MKALLVAAALFAVACGQQPKPAEKAAVAENKPVEYFHVDAATAGTIRGRIEYKGKKPARVAIDMSEDAACQQAHAGHPAYDESLVVGKKDGLENAFVYIQAGLEGKKFQPPTEAVVLDQHGCEFVPRVIGVEAAQPFEVKNSDSTSHNIHPMPQNNREWNEQQSPGTPDVVHKFARTEIMVPVKCNVHKWMHAYIGVVENPYFAVTGPDGTFELRNVPPGDYTIGVWQEKLGQKSQQVHVAASQTADVDFSYQ